MKYNINMLSVFLMSVFLAGASANAMEQQAKGDTEEAGDKVSDLDNEFDDFHLIEIPKDSDIQEATSATSEAIGVTVINNTNRAIDVAQVEKLGSLFGISGEYRIFSRLWQSAVATVYNQYERVEAQGSKLISVKPGNSLSFILINLEDAIGNAKLLATAATAIGGATAAIKTGALPAAVPCLFTAKESLSSMAQPGARLNDLKDGSKVVITENDDGSFVFDVSEQN